MIARRPTRQPDDGIVVIGGGPCASVAAHELVRAGHHVTMLDAGLRRPRGLTVHAAGRTILRVVEPGFDSVNRQRSATNPNMEWRSSLSLGGLSNYWTGAVPRFSPEDFTVGGDIDERYVWPVGYDELVPYYELVEDHLCITAGEPFDNVPPGRSRTSYRMPGDWAALRAAAARHGHSIGEMPIAKGRRWMVALRPREFTSYHALVKPIRASPNLSLVPGAHVLRLEYDGSSGAATSAIYVDTASGELREARGRAFVVAAGALDSTEILLRSVSPTFPNGLGNTHGVLGRYLHDHPKEWWPAQLAKPLTALYHPLFVPGAPSDRAALTANSLTLGTTQASDRIAALMNRAVPRVGVQVFGTMVPTDKPGITLDRDTAPDDPASALQIDLDFDAAARDTVTRGRERFQEIMTAAGNEARLGPFHELAPGSSFHLGGTVRMHERPEFGMVDRWNRLHDVPNVIVADASTFTTCPEKHPTLTAMALAARAARHLGAQSEH